MIAAAGKVLPAVCILLGAALACGPEAHPQASDQPTFEWAYDEVIAAEDLPGFFDPAKLGMTQIAPEQLYDELTRPGRCTSGKTGPPKAPCAFISYAPRGLLEGDYRRSLRPVFKVISKEKIWTVLKGEIARVGIEKLERASDFAVAPLFPATAVVGMKESEARCKTGQPCVDVRFFQKLFEEMHILSVQCVEEIWGLRPGPTEVGEVKCRYVKE